MKTQYLCFPLMKPSTTTTTAATSTASPATRIRAPPAASLLERLREAVFRLIMVTALSKINNNRSSSSFSSSASPSASPSSLSSSMRTPYHRHDNHNQSVRRSYYLHDPYPSEAVADCIEFIKKSSASSSPSDRDHHDDGAESTRGSTVTSDVVIPLPVM